MARHLKLSCARIFGLLACLLLCCLSRAAWAVPPQAPNMTAAAQDGSGTVWALPYDNYGNDQSENGVIYFWKAGWVKQALPEAAGFRPLTLAQGDDGSVCTLWQKRDPSWPPGQAHTAPTPCLITVHRGTRSRLLCQFTAALPVASGAFSGPLKLYAGKGGDAWIVSEAPTLLHVAPGGTVQSFPLTPDQVFGGRLLSGFPYPPICSSVDTLGRRWFWQADSNFWEVGTLRGFLIWDGRTLTYHAALPGLPDQMCSVIAPHGGRFLWAGQGGGNSHFGFQPALKLPGGLYKIDTRTLTAAPAALPPKAHPQAAFLQIERVFWVQGDLCVLEAGYTNYSSRSASLWRQQGTFWHKEPDALAWDQFPPEGYNPGGWTPRPALDTAAGTWLGINGAGLEWLPAGGKTLSGGKIPAGGEAISVNWRRGVTAGRVSALFRLPDGKIMPFPCSDAGALLLPHPPPLLPPRPSITLGTPGQPAGLSDMMADPSRRLWGFSYQPSGRQVLQEWDGSRWQAHLLPPFKSSLQSGALYACDTRGRVWITATIWNPPAQAQPMDTRFVYDPAHDAWTQYAAVPDAVAAAAQSGMAFLPNRYSSSLPVFSGDGRAAYTDNQSVFFYDGAKWRNWTSRDIQPGYAYSNVPDHPRFDPDGHLQVALADHLYGWTPEDGWQPKGFAPPDSPTPPLPPGGPPGFWGQPIRDNGGGGWLVQNGDVYLTRGGLWRRLAPLSGPGSPFYDGRSLQSVLQDPKGRFFFETTPGGFFEYVVWSPPDVPLAAPRIQIRPLSSNSVRLRFEAAAEGPRNGSPREFQWRLNGGAWRTLKPGSPVTLTALSPGTYRVEAQALSLLLQASPVPSAAVFTVQPPTAAQIAGWVRTLLSGPDSAREAAVAGLMKQPAAALPALEAARSGASEAGRWWIDAALQQLQSLPSL